MKVAPVTTDALRALPRAIWIAGSQPVAVYHGTPVEMVEEMADEMAPHLHVRQAIEALLTGLADNRGLRVALPASASDEDLAALFVYALLDTGIGRPLPEA